MAERFPGGVREFAQFVAQLPEDALNDVILQFQMDGVQQGLDGRMPGDFGNGGINVERGDDGPRDVEAPVWEEVREAEEELDGEHGDEASDEDEDDEDDEASPVSDDFFFHSYRGLTVPNRRLYVG